VFFWVREVEQKPRLGACPLIDGLTSSEGATAPSFGRTPTQGNADMNTHEQHEQHEQHEHLQRHELKGIQAGCLDKAMVDKMNGQKEQLHEISDIGVSAGRLPIGAQQAVPTVFRKRTNGIGPL